MGIEYSLFNTATKQYIRLGKRQGDGFQMPPERIAQFLASNLESAAGDFRIYNDFNDQPEQFESGWECRGTWGDALT